jgi:sporulation protein YlmC with PRC-barrel domain
MKRFALVSSLTACVCLVVAARSFAADPVVTGAVDPAAPVEKTAIVKPAEACLGDLSAFREKLDKDGYWLDGTGYGYGYPMGGFGYGYGYPVARQSTTTSSFYETARPGYEVRMLLASANILARNGMDKSCEEVLGSTREIYQQYLTDQHERGAPGVDSSEWQRQQIASAQPIAGNSTSFRSDQLLDTSVHNLHNEGLGSVHDLVISPETGKIAYLVIARGGIFGIGEKYVPVPWDDFKVTASANLLVLDTTTATLQGAPEVKDDQFSATGHFDQQSQAVDAYWKAHLLTKASN